MIDHSKNKPELPHHLTILSFLTLDQFPWFPASTQLPSRILFRKSNLNAMASGLGSVRKWPSVRDLHFLRR